MIDAHNTIETLKKRLQALIETNTINAELVERDEIISFYVYKSGDATPLQILRITDHRPVLQKMIRPDTPRPSVIKNSNLSVEFYVPNYTTDGCQRRNRFNTNINIPDTIKPVDEFWMTSIEYVPQLLLNSDVELIYSHIIEWLFANGIQENGEMKPYVDPFIGTNKEGIAQEKKSVTIIKPAARNMEIDAVGNTTGTYEYGADFVPESCGYKYNKTNFTLMRKQNNKQALYESIMRKVSKVVKQAINESDQYKRNILKESLDTPPYYWSISRCNEDWDAIECVEDSATSYDASADKFSTPDEAYADGLKNLKLYNDDRYVLEVYYFCPNGAGDYVSGYMAENEYGEIHEY